MCGSDGLTYINPCKAGCDKVSVLCQGACPCIVGSTPLTPSNPPTPPNPHTPPSSPTAPTPPVPEPTITPPIPRPVLDDCLCQCSGLMTANNKEGNCATTYKTTFGDTGRRWCYLNNAAHILAACGDKFGFDPEVGMWRSFRACTTPSPNSTVCINKPNTPPKIPPTASTEGNWTNIF